MNELFCTLILKSDLDEEELELIEDWLLNILDNSDNSIFQSNIIYNILSVIENKKSTTIFLNTLIKEVRLKGIRVYQHKLLNTNFEQKKLKCECEKSEENKIIQPCQKNNDNSTRRIMRFKEPIEKNGKKYMKVTEKYENTEEVIRIYEEEVNDECNDKDPLTASLKDIPLLSTFQNNIKLSENDL